MTSDKRAAKKRRESQEQKEEQEQQQPTTEQHANEHEEDATEFATGPMMQHAAFDGEDANDIIEQCTRMAFPNLPDCPSTSTTTIGTTAIQQTA